MFCWRSSPIELWLWCRVLHRRQWLHYSRSRLQAAEDGTRYEHRGILHLGDWQQFIIRHSVRQFDKPFWEVNSKSYSLNLDDFSRKSFWVFNCTDLAFSMTSWWLVLILLRASLFRQSEIWIDHAWTRGKSMGSWIFKYPKRRVMK